jgi:saccharopine dehydrogenase-like NADP-dependent oxidoreductase
MGAGSIGQAIIRRVSAGKHVVLADYSLDNAERAARTLEDAGFECSTIASPWEALPVLSNKLIP